MIVNIVLYKGEVFTGLGEDNCICGKIKMHIVFCGSRENNVNSEKLSQVM